MSCVRNASWLHDRACRHELMTRALDALHAAAQLGDVVVRMSATEPS
jgi:hypothetical protein